VRSYDQFCPLASALDLVGDRWTLLIVRELGIRASRYSDLHDALPGIATNLLAERLRSLTANGIISSRTMPAPSPATVYELTAWGAELYEVVLRLGRWGARTLLTPADDRTFRARYAIPVAQAVYGLDANLDGLEPITIRVDAGEESVRIAISSSGVEASIDVASDTDDHDVLIAGDPLTMIGLLAGGIDPDEAPDAFRATKQATRRWRSLTRRGTRPSMP